jgi:hypothetical protein
MTETLDQQPVWGTEPAHAVQAVQYLRARHGFAPNYNMLAGCTTYPWGVLNGRTIEAAIRLGLLIEVDRPFGGCKHAYEAAAEPIPKPPEYYCPTCARPAGNAHFPDECVCVAAGIPETDLTKVHVPGGQRAAQERLGAGVQSLGLLDLQRRSVMPVSEIKAALKALRVVGPKVPVTVEVTLTDRGWRIVAQPEAGQLTLGESAPAPYIATLPAHSCDRTPCTRGNCSKHGHCHGNYGGRHAEHVAVFVREMAKAYPGKVTLQAIPRHPVEAAA